MPPISPHFLCRLLYWRYRVLCITAQFTNDWRTNHGCKQNSDKRALTAPSRKKLSLVLAAMGLTVSDAVRQSRHKSREPWHLVPRSESGHLITLANSSSTFRTLLLIGAGTILVLRCSASLRKAALGLGALTCNRTGQFMN